MGGFFGLVIVVLLATCGIVLVGLVWLVWVGTCGVCDFRVVCIVYLLWVGVVVFSFGWLRWFLGFAWFGV